MLPIEIINIILERAAGDGPYIPYFAESRKKLRLRWKNKVLLEHFAHRSSATTRPCGLLIRKMRNQFTLVHQTECLFVVVVNKVISGYLHLCWMAKGNMPLLCDDTYSMFFFYHVVFDINHAILSLRGNIHILQQIRHPNRHWITTEISNNPVDRARFNLQRNLLVVDVY
jgi:hypothetical protein